METGDLTLPAVTAARIGDPTRRPWSGGLVPGCGGLALMVALMGLADAVLLAWTGLRITGLAAKLPFLAVLLAGSLFYTRVRPSPALAELSAFMGLWIGFSVAGAVMTYAAAALAAGSPLRDAALLQADRMMGFDWAEWTGFVRTHWLFGRVLWTGYASFMPQILGSVALFALLRVPDRNREFLAASGVALVLVSIGSAVLPSIGPCVAVGMDVPEPGVCAYVADMLALRGEGHSFDLASMQGIVTFPSFHTVIGILLPYAHRGLRPTYIAVLLLNAVMLVAIPSEGGHYVADMVGGAVIAAVAIAAVRRYPLRTASASGRPIRPS